MGREPDYRLGPEMEVPKDLAWPRMNLALESPKELYKRLIKK